MRSKNIFTKLLILLVFATLMVAENVIPGIGISGSVCISVIFFLLLIRFHYINSTTEAFLYGFIADSLISTLPFGVNSLLFLCIYGFINLFKNKEVIDLILIFVYATYYIVVSLILTSFNLKTLGLNLIYYVAFRIIVLILFKK